MIRVKGVAAFTTWEMEVHMYSPQAQLRGGSEVLDNCAEAVAA